MKKIGNVGHEHSSASMHYPRIGLYWSRLEDVLLSKTNHARLVYQHELAGSSLAKNQVQDALDLLEEIV